jgi:large subunit ribosomal protein L25
VKVPIHLRGTAHGVTEGGELLQLIAEIEVEAGLLEIPDTLVTKIDHLELGSALHARELVLPPGVTLTAKPDEIIAIVRAKKTAEEVAPVAAEATAEATAVQPEVIGRVAKEEPAGEAGA